MPKTARQNSLSSVVQAAAQIESVKKKDFVRRKGPEVEPGMVSRDPLGQNEQTERDAEIFNNFHEFMSSKIQEREEEYKLPFPYLPDKALFCLYQTTVPRYWCIKLTTNKWFDRCTMVVILVNCVLMGLYRPCEDDVCLSTRCRLLQIADNVIFGYFAIEMVLKMVAFGVFGKKAYLSDSWNRLDCFIVVAGLVQYVLESQFSGDINLTAIRTIRVLRPLRAVNRISSLRVVVRLLLDTMPMVGNVLMLCTFVFFVFGIVAVQLWKGGLRNRCIISDPVLASYSPLGKEYVDSEGNEYLCHLNDEYGIHSCLDLEPTMIGNISCNGSFISWSENSTIFAQEEHNDSCINWNQYYNTCIPTDHNPRGGAVSFDNIASGWLTIFVVISLEGWVEIMYYIQDSQTFWACIYFLILIVIGAFFMINLFLVVISCQFGETRKRETARMLKEREEANKNAQEELVLEEWDLVDEGEVDSYGMYETVVRSLYKAFRWTIFKAKTLTCLTNSSISKSTTNGKMVTKSAQTNNCNRTFLLSRVTAKEMVLGNKFRLLIMMAILLNTAALALEHHNQPETWTRTLETCNLIFTIFFLLEMLIKLFALGAYDYFIDPFNSFDGVIVIVSIIDVVQEGEGQGLSVLRTFRLLRIIKLIRFLPALKHQLGIMIETLDEVTVFFGVMSLFIFIFSLMGMVLFGGKFCAKDDGSSCNCFDIAVNSTSCDCSRTNFDTFFNASLTVFQILTTEDWNEVLFDGMHHTGPWASVYFVILMTIGNYILLNLLVAILVDGVQQQQDKEDIEKAAEEQKESKKHAKNLATDLLERVDTCILRDIEHEHEIELVESTVSPKSMSRGTSISIEDRARDNS